MADLDLRQAERRASDDPSAARRYLINQLRTGQYDSDSIIDGAFRHEDAEYARRCLQIIPSILSESPDKIVPIVIRMLDYWDANPNPENYHDLERIESILIGHLNNNPLEVSRLLDLLNNWEGGEDQPSYHSDAYTQGERPSAMTENLFYQLNMFEDFGLPGTTGGAHYPGYDWAGYTINWVIWCARHSNSEEEVAYVLWDQIRNWDTWDFFGSTDQEVVQNFGHTAIDAIKNPQLREDFIKKLDYFREQVDLTALGNPDFERQLNMFADAFQSGDFSHLILAAVNLQIMDLPKLRQSIIKVLS